MCSVGDWRSFLEEALSSSSGPLLASLSAFWLRLSEKASSLGRRRHVNWECYTPEDPGCAGLLKTCLRGWINIHLTVNLSPQLRVSHFPLRASPPHMPTATLLSFFSGTLTSAPPLHAYLLLSLPLGSSSLRGCSRGRIS